MKKQKKQIILAIVSILWTIFFFTGGNAFAHCDTLNGPVVAEARKALTDGDVTPLLKWIPEDDEAIIRESFENTLAVRKLGEKAAQLADMYFFETLVRIHRAGEGVPYTGLKPGTEIDKAVILADKALESDSVEKLSSILTGALEKGISQRFQRAMETRKKASADVAAGREYVEAYVQFTHFVEGIHGLIKGGSPHHEHP